MFQTQLINQVVEWERRLEIEEERRKNHQVQPYSNNLAVVQDCRKERKSIFAQIFQPARDPQPVDCPCPCPQELKHEGQPG